ncbi:BOI-related E3 ubiquitin-protein ligase 1-like [Salvia hispanica]|uniref:BOI-related E3 ubiquitin-protein ligase 1-like n=1 Tax=Salvia hispanica TaxID=49212 RepID=UPI002009630A|nr:BOI-related E3 ubiquitin-protein ligase 1-like [Salvia hispanica]XP_047952748.1 BOI-related E3 ubiquitin-protein ligase 1-like [Salvia hispanica]
MDFDAQHFPLVWFHPQQLPDLDVASEIHNQNAEIDHFLHLQSSRLRIAIMEEEARQREIAMQRYEARANALLLHKDQQIAAARGRTIELQRFLKSAEMEAAAWERAARERESAAAELTKQLMEATSFCFSSSSSTSAKVVGIKNCKVCHGGEASVVLFPCRHICCCRSCEPLLDHCPLCQTLKEATLQVFI